MDSTEYGGCSSVVGAVRTVIVTDSSVNGMSEVADRSSHGDDGPVVLVTGAGSGIGKATATMFANRGWLVYATDIETPLPESVATRCRTLALDVTDAEQCQTVVDRIVAETGRIDVLVNNAGYAVPGVVEDVPIEETKREFDVLVYGVQQLVQLVVPIMRENGRGRIVTVSSVLGRAAYPGLGVYSAGKAAAESLTDALRMELRDVPGVDVSLVEAAWVDTEFAAEATETLADRDRTASYAPTYAALEDGWALDGGPLATTPDAVAETIVHAATTSTPKARYPVGAPAQFVRWSQWLPASVLDPMRRLFGQASITARSLHAALARDRGRLSTEPASVTATGDGSGSEPVSDRSADDRSDSSRTLSTGHTVSLPLSTDATIVGATLPAAIDSVRDLLPSGLAPVRVTPSRAAITFLCVEYERIGDGAIDPYAEFGVLVPATPGTGTPPLSVPLTSEVGAYVWLLPVTTEPARALGVEGWGYPKSIAEIELRDDGRRRTTTVTSDGDHICSIEIKRPRTVSGTVSTRSYTTDEGTIYRQPLTLDGQLGAAPLSTDVSVTFGTHDRAVDLRSLDLGTRAIARMGFEGEFTIHAGEPVDQP